MSFNGNDKWNGNKQLFFFLSSSVPNTSSKSFNTFDFRLMVREKKPNRFGWFFPFLLVAKNKLDSCWVLFLYKPNSWPSVRLFAFNGYGFFVSLAFLHDMQMKWHAMCFISNRLEPFSYFLKIYLKRSNWYSISILWLCGSGGNRQACACESASQRASEVVGWPGWRANKKRAGKLTSNHWNQLI